MKVEEKVGAVGEVESMLRTNEATDELRSKFEIVILVKHIRDRGKNRTELFPPFIGFR